MKRNVGRRDRRLFGTLEQAGDQKTARGARSAPPRVESRTRQAAFFVLAVDFAGALAPAFDSTSVAVIR